jgi:DNA-binding transcriptional MerR regulator
MLDAQKSPEAFRTISEVASELDVPQHVLRFWETKFGSVKPLKRGGGRRYYRPDDVDLLRGIRALLYGDGLTIKGVQKILREQGVRYVAEIGRGSASLTPAREPKKSVSVPPAQAAEDAQKSNVHPFPRAGGFVPAPPPPVQMQARSIDEAHFSALIVELTELKERLRAARR